MQRKDILSQERREDLQDTASPWVLQRNGACESREGSINLLGAGMGEVCSPRKCYPGPKRWRKWNCDGFGDAGVISELGNRLGHTEGSDVVQSSESARFEYWLCHVLTVRLWANDLASMSQISRNRTGVLCVS